jgi:hypothetical protein
MLTRRLQVLLDQPRYDRLAREAKRRKMSIGALVRDAVDHAYPIAEPRVRAAAQRILDAEPMAVPAPDGLRAELEELRGRG